MGMAGPSAGQTLTDWVLEVNAPSYFGGTALSPDQAAFETVTYGGNLLVNGSFESWSAGTTSAPDAWTLTGAGATIARNVTNIQKGLASVNVTAALDTATDLAHTVTISSTVNTHLRGKVMTFSCLVRTATAGRVFLKMDDGIGTTDSLFELNGDSVFRLITVTRTIATTATKIECSLEISSGASITATFDAAQLEEGSIATAFSQNQRDPFLQIRTANASNEVTRILGTLAEIPDMSHTNVILDGTQSALIALTIEVKSTDTSDVGGINLFRDSTQLLVGAEKMHTVNKFSTFTRTMVDIKPAAGNYNYRAQWASDGSATLTAANRTFSVAIIPSA